MPSNDLNDFLVLASHDGRIQAVDARDGRVRWTQTCEHPFFGLALVRVGNELVAASGDGYLYVLALDTGTIRWKQSLPITAPVLTPMDGFRVAAGQNLAAVLLGSRIFALDMVDGHMVWETKPSSATRQWWLLAAGADHVYTLQAETVFARPSVQDTPEERQSEAPHAAPRLSLVTTAFSAWDGTPHWFAQETSAIEPPWDAGSSLVEADGVAYLCGRRGLHALEASSGTLLWSCDITPQHHVGALAVGRDFVAVTAGGHFGIYRRDTGTPLWLKTAEKRADGYFEWFAAPQIVGDAVYVGRCMSGPQGFQVEAYATETGALGWVWPGPAVGLAVDNQVSWRYRGAGTTLYVPSYHDLWAIQAADGRERWHLTDIFGSSFDALLAVTTADS